MRVWIYLFSAGVLLSTVQSGWAQRSTQQQAGRGNQATGGFGTAGAATQGPAGGGLGAGPAFDQNLTDPDQVFEIQRGSGIGASTESVQGFSAIGGAGGAGGVRGGALGGAFGGGLGGLGGLFGGGNMFNSMQQQEPATQVRTRLRSGIRTPNPPTPQVEARIESRWAKLPAQPRFHDVQIEMRGRTAILNGKVKNGEDRRMAELLIRLEPGVSQIENQLLVAGEGPANDLAAPGF